LQVDEEGQKRDRANIASVSDQQWSSIMWAILSLIYRLSCRARLMEMRRRNLAAANW